MQPSQRIARVEVGNYRLPTADFAGLEDLHRELTATIRRHLPGVTASLLALPVPADDGVTVDWYSDLGGQPLPLASLPPPRRALVREKLKDRLQSLQRLADELPRRQRGSEDLARALRAAAQYPGDEHVFAVGDEPVLTLWGFVRARGGKRLATPSQADAEGSRRRWLTGLGLTALLLAGLAGAGWYFWMHEREQALRDEVAGALVSGCVDPGALAVLGHRLDQIDPGGQGLEEMRRRISAEQQRCAEAAALDDAITAAGWDCAAVAALPRRLAQLDPAREPVPALAARLDRRTAVCDQAAQLAAKLDQSLGTCDAVAALANELPTDPIAPPSPPEGVAADGGDETDALPEPLARLRARVDAELDLCANAATLSDEVAAASAQCERLLRLDGRLAGLDASRPPLSPVRERLDTELARCARADAFSRDLIDAQMDCTRLKDLDGRMQGEDMSQPPLLPVRERLDKALEQCRALDKLEQALRDAGQDCGRLAALAEDLRDAHPNNPIFVDLRRRIVAETRLCDLAESLRAQLAAASGDCTALAELAPDIETAGDRPPELSSTLKAELALCAQAKDWRQRIVGADCERLESLRSSLPKAAANSGQFAEIREQLAAADKRCRRVALASAESPAEARERPVAPAAAGKPAADPKKTTSKPARRNCPGTRVAGETPQLVMVFDASGSMRHGINADAGALRQLRQIGDGPVGAALGVLGSLLGKAASGPSRMQVAKDAGRRIVGGLPADVDVGLVKIEDCPGATNAGFYTSARRGALLGQIGAMQPRKETPLASAIAQAASMVDGVNRPGVIAVITDGEDTCGGNVCATAARIARSKPKLKINVVDIAGIGAANCAARATGGRVLRAGNAAELSAQMKRATEDVMGPSECRGG